ncbi:MAG: argininosuccinate lyase [Syntrophobacteraceae bacterium]|nr:argininosuccinate lyase [Desulfobacteraceae bacterium]
MLRDSRLGAISKDVLEFLSSREPDKKIFQADLLVDRAHLIMLKEQGWVSAEECSTIIETLAGIEESELGEAEDIAEAIEGYVLAKMGPQGGRMHTGRSRNDKVATSIRLALREEMLGLMDEQLSLIGTLVELAGKHTDSVMPGFTHTQHAQPTTLAHYLMSYADAFLRDLNRLEEAYRRVNLSPLGAAAFASTGFKIDRLRTCRLLGFDGLVENSMDAVSTRDFILEVLADLSIHMVNLSRLSEEIVLWSTQEFGYIELDNLFASTSSIMPQKKNPDTAEIARAKTGSVLGSLISALAILKALPMSYNRDLQEVTPHLWRGMDWTRGTVRILDGCLSTMKFNEKLMEERSGEGFSTATELADVLVRKMGIPFRTAHRIVGRLAAGSSLPTFEELEAVTLEMAGLKPGECGMSAVDLAKALDPRSNVAVRAGTGGPSPAETARMIEERRGTLARQARKTAELRARAEEAVKALLAMR